MTIQLAPMVCVLCKRFIVPTYETYIAFHDKTYKHHPSCPPPFKRVHLKCAIEDRAREDFV